MVIASIWYNAIGQGAEICTDVRVMASGTPHVCKSFILLVQTILEQLQTAVWVAPINLTGNLRLCTALSQFGGPLSTSLAAMVQPFVSLAAAAVAAR